MPNYQRRIVYLSEAQREELFSNGSITVNGTTITYDANDMYVTPQEEPYVKPASGIPATDLASGVVPDLTNYVQKTDYATSDNAGVVKVLPSRGIMINSTDKRIQINPATSSQIKESSSDTLQPIVPGRQDQSVFYGLAKAAGDTTQASSSNAVGTYTNNAKTAIQTMLGVESGVSFVETVSGATPSITGEPNTRYMCGEVTSIAITSPSAGTIDVIFTSGSTPAVLTVTPPTGMTMKWPAWFDPTSLATNTTYEINIMDGVYGAVMAW